MFTCCLRLHFIICSSSMQEPEKRSGCRSPLRAFSIIDCQKTCSPKACHQGIQLSYHIFRARRVRDRSCRCHGSCRACWTSCSRWACRAGCSSRSCRAYRSGCPCWTGRSRRTLRSCRSSRTRRAYCSGCSCCSHRALRSCLSGRACRTRRSRRPLRSCRSSRTCRTCCSGCSCWTSRSYRTLRSCRSHRGALFRKGDCL